MAWFNKTTDAAEANAEFAVRAVNCHADLLEACKAMLMDSGCPIGHQKADRWAKACDLAREALRKAEGEEGVKEFQCRKPQKERIKNEVRCM